MSDDRPRIALVFGSGLDRATGILGASVRSMRDVRNVYLYRDKAQARKGHAVASTLTDGGTPMSDILLVAPMRSEQIGIVVAWNTADRAVRVFRVDSEGQSPSLIGTWFTLQYGAHEPPRIIAAESYRKLFLAHDEPTMSKRAQTYYYDPMASGSQLIGLTADLDRNGTAEAIRFRGVQDYLNYLVGWGYGTGSDEDRPEIVRVSLPGDPTSFEPEHYFVAGARFDPVLRCLPTADRLVVFKAANQYEIVGYDRQTFGIKPGDQLYGLAASRLAISVGGTIYFWDAAEGPRRTTGGTSSDLAWPLDLAAPPPATLLAEGALADGFAQYLPGRRVIQFIFGRRTYNLSIWDPEQPKWSYGELGVNVFCGGLLYGGGETAVQAPQGAPSDASATAASNTSLTISWTNNLLAGGELVEIWLKPTGGSFSLATSLAANGATQATTVGNLEQGTTYSVALRYRKGVYYSPNSSSANPDDWPAAQRTSGTTTIAAPTLTSVHWSRTSATTEQAHLEWSAAEPTASTQIWRNGILITTVPAGTSSYDDTTITGETSVSFKLRHVKDATSPDSNTITQWMGPSPPPSNVASETAGCNLHENLVSWTNGDPSLQTEIWARNITRSLAYQLVATAQASLESACAQAPGAQTGDTVAFNVRHKQVSFGVADFSAYTSGTSNPAIDEARTTAP